MKLTLDMFVRIPYGEIFATGYVCEPRLARSEKTGIAPLLRWVAVKGFTEDWAIYYGYSFFPINKVEAAGEKIQSKDIIQNLVPCDDETLAAYRY